MFKFAIKPETAIIDYRDDRQDAELLDTMKVIFFTLIMLLFFGYGASYMAERLANFNSEIHQSFQR